MGPFPLKQRTASSLQREQCTAALCISASPCRWLWAEGVKLRRLYNARCQEICKFTAWAAVPGARVPVKPRGQGSVRGASVTPPAPPAPAAQCSAERDRSSSRSSRDCQLQLLCRLRRTAMELNRAGFPFINSICSALLKDSISLI